MVELDDVTLELHQLDLQIMEGVAIANRLVVFRLVQLALLSGPLRSRAFAS